MKMRRPLCPDLGPAEFVRYDVQSTINAHDGSVGTILIPVYRYPQAEAVSRLYEQREAERAI